jgi:hypothetical protein
MRPSWLGFLYSPPLKKIETNQNALAAAGYPALGSAYAFGYRGGVYTLSIRQFTTLKTIFSIEECPRFLIAYSFSHFPPKIQLIILSDVGNT